MNNPFTLQGKKILITGASSGIGRECAVLCSRMGASIIAVGRNSERLNETLDMLEDSLAHQALQLDLNDTETVDREMEKLESDGLQIHGVIHSAGISTTLPLRMISPDKLQPYFDTNVSSAIYLTKWVTRKKLVPETGSSIVFLSSVMGSVGEA